MLEGLYHVWWLPALAFCASLCSTGWLLLLLRRAALLDVPNDRSNHTVPTPRGGGLAMHLSMMPFLYLANIPLSVLAAMLLLLMLSFLDDRYSLSAPLRFGVQCLTIAGLLLFLPPLKLVWLPTPLTYIITLLAWLWFINLTNFMDGIDEISSRQAVMTMLGVILLAVFHTTLADKLALQASIVMTAVAGFWWYNRHPARLFMGDAGSIPLGLILGYLLYTLAIGGFLLSALIIPAYYLTDASVTLLRRAVRGAPLMQAHSEHAYQVAARAFRSHRRVLHWITGLNIVLVLLAFVAPISMMAGIVALTAAYGLSYSLTVFFRHAASR